MNHRENRIAAARFEKPDTIPLNFIVSPSCWNAYPRDALGELMASHPLLCPGFEKAPEGEKEVTYHEEVPQGRGLHAC